MLMPMKWLREYIDIDMPVDEYVNKMVMAGNGVEGVDDVSRGVKKVVVARVLSVKKLEGSDRLYICKVDVGDSVIQVLTTATNLFDGALVPVALDGAKLADGREIKKVMMRGEETDGMFCSSVEVDVPQDLYPSVGNAGILILNEDYPLGTDITKVLWTDDQAIDFEVLANRPDCLSIWGMARESAAVLGTKYKAPELTVEEADVPPIGDSVSIEVQDTEKCPRYIGKLIRNVRIAPSPMWLRAYLHAAGLRSINNIVDITNFVMIETGNPMHAFDLSKVRDGKIIVRCARPGEKLKTLDEKERELDENMLVIADAENATGLAGIMGGEESEITEATTDVLFECAAFDRTSIRLTSRQLGMRTDASGHFERGVCPAMSMDAMLRACQLVNLLDAGDVAPGIVDIYPNPQPQQVIEASVQRICERIGIDVPADRIVEILNSLEIRTERDGDKLTCQIPRFRMDMDGEADISEEVLRLYGYDNIPCTLMKGTTMRGGRNQTHITLDHVRESLLAVGGYEVITYSFISPRDVEKLGLPEGDPRLDMVRILNPLGEDTSVMRTTLVPSMLRTLSYNLRSGNERALLFETAVRFIKTDEEITTPDGNRAVLPKEQLSLCVGMYGGDADFYRLKFIVDELLTHFGETGRYTAGGDVYYHPGRKALITVNGKPLGQLGEIHPDVSQAFDAEGARLYVAEIDIPTLAENVPPIEAPKPIPRFPAVARDIALVMDEKQQVGDILDEIKHAVGAICENVTVFDVYRGMQLGLGKKSVAFAITLRAQDHTLVEEEINKAVNKAINNCKFKFGTEIR